MQLTTDELKELKDIVERIPQFEEKLGVRLENISFSNTEFDFNIHGDFFMDELDNFDNYFSIDIWATLYDQDNDILASESTTIFKDDFLGFETFTITIFAEEMDLKSIKKIRVYIKPCSS